jgi:Zn-dependent protease
MTGIYYYDYRGPPRGKYGFSDEELKQIIIAVMVLIVAFTVIWSKPGYFRLSALLVAIPVVSTAFLLHELGHKFSAQKYGCWAEFRMSIQGLFMALIFSFFGFLFAAPGAVYIQGYLTKEQNGKVSLRGPLINVYMALIFIVFLVLSLMLNSPVLLIDIFHAGVFVNAFLGAFNLIPFGPFDGLKVLAWNKLAWSVVLIILVCMLILVFPNPQGGSPLLWTALGL